MRSICRSLLLLFATAATSGGQNADAVQKRIEVYDAFETPGLSKSWETIRFAPGAVEMQSDIVRAGRGAAKVTVKSRDKFETGINGNSDSERAELMEARALTSRENDAYEFSFSMFFPQNFQIVPVRLVVAQWKQYCPEGGNCSDDSPVLAIRYISGALMDHHGVTANSENTATGYPSNQL
jgi:hypothetical protein